LRKRLIDGNKKQRKNERSTTKEYRIFKLNAAADCTIKLHMLIPDLPSGHFFIYSHNRYF